MRKTNLSGQALVTMIVFVSIALIIISASITMIAVNSEAATVSQEGLLVKQASEAGVENALLKLLRDPSYNGETINPPLLNYPTQITVSGDDINKTIVSTATSNNFQRKIQVKINYTGNVMKVIFWQDIL